jgi:hypothetical protein
MWADNDGYSANAWDCGLKLALPRNTRPEMFLVKPRNDVALSETSVQPSNVFLIQAIMTKEYVKGLAMIAMLQWEPDDPLRLLFQPAGDSLSALSIDSAVPLPPNAQAIAECRRNLRGLGAVVHEAIGHEHSIRTGIAAEVWQMATPIRATVV